MYTPGRGWLLTTPSPFIVTNAGDKGGYICLDGYLEISDCCARSICTTVLLM